MSFTQEIRNNPSKWTSWILQCGCEPCAEHCDQCDGRRKIRSQWEKEDAELKAVKHVESFGYRVIKCN